MKIDIGPYNSKTDKRNISIHIDGYDTWGLDHTLAVIIYPALIQLRDTMPGIPADFTSDFDYSPQYSFDFYEDTSNDEFEKRVEMWRETMNKMIWAFREIAEGDYEEKYHHGDPQYSTDVTQDGYVKLVKQNHEAWVDYEGIKAHEEKIDEGLMLFAKYFRNLWE